MGEPSCVLAPTRGPIEVLCDQRTAPRLANAAMRRHLTRGVGGPLVLGTSLALGFVLGAALHSALVGTLYALGTLTFQLVSGLLRTRRSFRKLAPSGQLLVTRYDHDGRLALTSAIGTSAMSPGSIDRVERRGGLVQVRTVPGRRWVILPEQLLTEEDTAHLLDRRRTPRLAPRVGASSAGSGTLQAPGEATTSTDTLDLLHVVDAQVRRDLQGAVAAHLLRSRDGKVLLASVVLIGASVVLVHDWVVFTMLGVALVVAAVNILVPVLRVRRSRPLGQLLRAAVTPTHLVVDEGGSESRLPWASIRSCSVTRGAVLLKLRQGVVLPVPRSLFPQAELAQLQQLVREHGGA